MRKDAADPLIVLGVCIGAQGVRGELRIKTFTDHPEGLGAYGPLLSEAGEIVLTPVRVRALKPDVAALSAREVGDRDRAEALRGLTLHVRRSALPRSEDAGEVLIADLIGSEVLHRDGRSLGVVVEVANFGAGDLIAVEGGAGRWWLPFTRDNVPDLQPGRMIVDPPLGLEPEEPAP